LKPFFISVAMSGAFSGVACAKHDAAGTNKQQRIKAIFSFIRLSFLAAHAKPQDIGMAMINT
jgi:hypothetical protein